MNSILAFIATACAYGHTPVTYPFVIRGNTYQEPSMDKKSIRLLIWNIHKEVRCLKSRRNLRKIKELNPDVILLQEVRLETRLVEILEDHLEMGWEFSPNTYQRKYESYSGVLTASSSQPAVVDPGLSNGREPFARTSKPMLFTKYTFEDSDRELLVVNVHGINFQLGNYKFMEQLQLIAKIIRIHEGPVIMGGDFNSWKKSRLAYLHKVIDALDMMPVNFEPNSKRIKRVFRNPLDHIFYRKSDFEVVKGSADVLDDMGFSDHQPLIVELNRQW